MAATTDTAAKIRTGTLVIYNGSIERETGIIFRVKQVETHHDQVRYMLAYRGDTETVLRHVRHESLTSVAAKDILHRTCKVCGWGPYWYLRGTGGDCPRVEAH